MKLEKAIQILINDLRGDMPELNSDLPDAHRLSIEALKRVKVYKDFHIGLHYEPMPGETED